MGVYKHEAISFLRNVLWHESWEFLCRLKSAKIQKFHRDDVFKLKIAKYELSLVQTRAIQQTIINFVEFLFKNVAHNLLGYLWLGPEFFSSERNKLRCEMEGRWRWSIDNVPMCNYLCIVDMTTATVKSKNSLDKMFASRSQFIWNLWQTSIWIIPSYFLSFHSHEQTDWISRKKRISHEIDVWCFFVEPNANMYR